VTETRINGGLQDTS